VEVPLDYSSPIPEGYDLIDLPPCKTMIFQGEQYDDADFEQAISNLWAFMKYY